MSNIKPFPMLQYWEQVLDVMPDVVLCVDQQDRIRYGNDKACVLLGYDLDELKSLTLHQLFSNDGFLKSLPSIRESGSYHEAEVVGKNGKAIVSQVSINEVNDADSQKDTIRLVIIKDMRKQKNEESVMQKERTRFEYLFNNISEAVFLAPIDENGVHGNFVEVNEVACQRLGYTREEMLQFNARSINPNANLNIVKSFGRNIVREGRVVFEAIHAAKDGTQIPVEVAAKVVTIDGQDYVLSIVRDLREQKELTRTQERFGKLMEHSWDEIYVFDSDTLKLLQVNHGAVENLGYSKKTLLELTVVDLMPDITLGQFRAMAYPLFDGSKSRIIFETRHQRKDGSSYPVEVRLQLSHNEVPPVFMANVQDITQRKHAEERLKYLANYDSLTGLPNRTLFMDRLSMALEGSRRSEMLAALVFIDLDGFKLVNDTLGHEAGDMLIKEVGNRLSACVRKSDTVARLGGDEFTVILTNIKNVEGVDIITDKILSTISTPFTIYDTEVQTSSSLGVSIFPMSEAEDAQSLLKEADAAMYNAKNSGKNNCKYYSASIGKNETKRASMELELKSALERQEFYLNYQPKVDLNTGRITGAEALLRWESDVFGVVLPSEFVPILESSGLIRKVGYWVLEQAVIQVKKWLESGVHTRVAINVSARQFDEDLFPLQLKEVLERYNVPGEFIEVEITEGLLISKEARILNNLRAIKDCGVHISLDDFGTGYSSLSYLKQFPIDVIKIDRSFVMDLNDGDSIAIVDAILGLAKALKIQVTAEGIETEEQLKILQERNCEEGQGFYFGRPMGVAQLENMIRQSVGEVIAIDRQRNLSK